MKTEIGALQSVDPRVVYPCYKSFDEFIDVERLKSLDRFVRTRIEDHVFADRDDYFLNEFRLDPNSPHAPGVREIWLTRPRTGTGDDYLNLDKPDLWQPTEAIVEFRPLMEFIATLPFKATGRMLIIYDFSGNAVPAHRDHLRTDLCHHFVWFRTNLSKPFYVLNATTGVKSYVTSYSAWFDTVNQFHGSEATEDLSFSIRVDGIFTDEFLASVPVPAFNEASRPALWCAVGNLEQAS